jgi:cytochrome c peroxidase
MIAVPPILPAKSLRSLRALVVAVGVLISFVASGGDAYRFDLPVGVPPPVVPRDNPLTHAKIELGRRLFYDKRLSIDESISCASCHRQERGFADKGRVPFGVTGAPGNRNPPGLANIAYYPTLTWANPTLTRLEMQALRPIFNEHPVEMGMAGKESELFERLARDARYPEMFRNAFPETSGRIDLTAMMRALSSFGRTILSFDSPYDRYRYRGDKEALSLAARRGEALFMSDRLKCASCHSGINLTDNIRHQGNEQRAPVYHNTGLYNEDGNGAYPAVSHGIRDITHVPGDEGRFRTPSLRNVALTAPYMHDGSIPTLTAVIRDHYARGGKSVFDGKPPNPLRSRLIAGFAISESEISDVIAFLESLTDDSFVRAPVLGDPFESESVPLTPAAR